MTDESYLKLKEDTKFYKIELTNGKFKCELVDKKYFEDSWIVRGWLNKDVVHRGSETRVMYCTEDKLESSKNKMVNYLIKEQKDIIRDANKVLEKLQSISITA